MSYCRFQNTVEDLRDCLEAINEAGGVEELAQDFEENGKDTELRALRKLVKLCTQIAELEEEEIDD